MIIQNSSVNDIDTIKQLYGNARAFQQLKHAVRWPEFDTALIETAIEEQRQWKIIIDHQVACIWTITFNDPQIWEERNIDPAIYIHRIATNPLFRGQNLVEAIVQWARIYATENNKYFIRLDTVGENTGLINYYQQCGFSFLGLYTLKNTDALPAHYKNATVSLFEIALSN